MTGSFVFQLKSVVRCKVCNYQSARFDPFTFLSLPLPMESTVNLEAVGGCGHMSSVDHMDVSHDCHMVGVVTCLDHMDVS